MRQGYEGHGKRLFMIAALALVVGACSGTGATGAPPTGGNGSTGAPGTGQNGGSGMAGAVSNLSGVKSYKFSETLAGGTYSDILSAFGGSGSGDAPFTVSGTVVTQPDTAADITMGSFHIIEIGG